MMTNIECEHGGGGWVKEGLHEAFMVCIQGTEILNNNDTAFKISIYTDRIDNENQ